MNILVIPEDFRKDQYILKPLFEALVDFAGRPRTKVRICNPPLLQGVSEALRINRLDEIVDRYPIVDLFILCVDRDGQVGRADRLAQIEEHFAEKKVFFAENAWEELETWLLAGLDLPPRWQWADVRSEISCKEVYFDKIAKQRQVEDGPGGGRKMLGIEAARRVRNIIDKCPEDFGRLAGRVRAHLNPR